MYEPTRRHLLRDLTGAGVGAAGAGLIGRELLGHPDQADSATPSCTLSPEVTEGPYYLDLDKVRRDVTEGKPGLRLDLRIKVVNATTCKPIDDVAVEIWHADAGGTYSGFSQEGTAGKTYLRGVQLTGESGVAQFRTVYPGWYPGRAIHIHMKAHVGERTAHTGQLFFHESVNDRVVRLSPYNGRGGTRMRNREDSIYPAGGVRSSPPAAAAQGEHDPQGADRNHHGRHRSLLGRRSRPTPDVGRLLGPYDATESPGTPGPALPLLEPLSLWPLP